MIIFFHKETLAHHHVIHTVDMTDTSLWDDRNDWVEVHHSAGVYPHHDIEVTRDADGTIGVRHKPTGQALPIVRRLATFSVGATLAKVGEILRLTGIPRGAAILFRGRRVGTMDDPDGVLEVEIREPGLHRFQFELDGYKPQSLEIDVA